MAVDVDGWRRDGRGALPSSFWRSGSGFGPGLFPCFEPVSGPRAPVMIPLFGGGKRWAVSEKRLGVGLLGHVRHVEDQLPRRSPVGSATFAASERSRDVGPRGSVLCADDQLPRPGPRGVAAWLPRGRCRRCGSRLLLEDRGQGRPQGSSVGAREATTAAPESVGPEVEIEDALAGPHRATDKISGTGAKDYVGGHGRPLRSMASTSTMSSARCSSSTLRVSR